MSLELHKVNLRVMIMTMMVMTMITTMMRIDEYCESQTRVASSIINTAVKFKRSFTENCFMGLLHDEISQNQLSSFTMMKMC